MADPNPPVPPAAPNPPTWRTQVSRLFATTSVRQVLLVLGLTALVYTLSIYSRDFGERKATEWLNLYNATDVKANTPIVVDIKPDPDPDANGNSNASTPRPTATANANANTNADPNTADTQTTTTSNSNVGANTNPGAAGGADAPAQGVRPGAAGQATATAAKAPEPPTAVQQKRLDEQLAGIRARRNHHGAVMGFFFKAYYMAISVVMFAGVVAALALFFIAQNGWSGTNPYVKTVFLVMTAATAYFGLYPSVFQQQQNISDNKTLFLAYKALENEVISYPLTLTDNNGEAKTATQFITYVDSKMGTLGNIAIGFDYTKINYTGAFELNKPSGQGNTNANTGNSNTQGQKK